LVEAQAEHQTEVLADQAPQSQEVSVVVMAAQAAATLGQQVPEAAVLAAILELAVLVVVITPPVMRVLAAVGVAAAERTVVSSTLGLAGVALVYLGRAVTALLVLFLMVAVVVHRGPAERPLQHLQILAVVLVVYMAAAEVVVGKTTQAVAD
jgi:hypothetical protein